MATEWILTEGTPYPHLSDVERLPDFGYSDFAEPYPTWMWRLVSVHRYPYLAPLTPVDTSFPSGAYRTAIARHSRRSKMTGMVTPGGDGAVPFDIADEDIVSGSLRITQELMSDDFYTPGGVPCAELQLGLFTAQTGVELYGAEIALSFWLYLEDIEAETEEERWYEIPLGAFTVQEAVRSSERALTIKAYDDMVKFERVSFADLEIEQGRQYTPFEIIVLVAAAAGIELATSQAFIDGLRNGQTKFTLSDINSGIVTARDLLMHICQIIGCFAFIDRWRRLCIRKLGLPRDTDPEITATIASHQRYRSEYSQLIYQLYALELHTVKYNSNGTGSEVLDIKHVSARPIGVTVELPENPLWPVLSYEDEEWRVACELVLQHIGDDLENVMYPPSECVTTGDPSLTLGDWVDCTGWTAGESTQFPLTTIEWVYHGQTAIRACGKDAIAGVVKSQKDKAEAASQENALWFSLTVMRDIYLRMMQYYSGLKGFTHKEIGQFTHKQIEEGKA